jgi:hypothetical protein
MLIGSAENLVTYRSRRHLINMTKIRKSALITSLLLVTSFLPASAQNRGYRGHGDNRGNQSFYGGMRGGGRGGQYYDPRYDNRRYNDGYNNGSYRNQGGIGPGKGALIGGAGGAALGAIFGGGLKGTLIGGAAGAGIGAVVGNVNQNHQRDRYRRR